MSLTKDSRILSVLEKKALRYHRKGQGMVDIDEILFNEAINETGTVLTEGLTDTEDSTQGAITTQAMATYLGNEKVTGVKDNLLTIWSWARSKTRRSDQINLRESR